MRTKTLLMAFLMMFIGMTLYAQNTHKNLIKKIDDIRIDKKIDGIQEVRDESAADVRVVIELKKNAKPSSKDFSKEKFAENIYNVYVEAIEKYNSRKKKK